MLVIKPRIIIGSRPLLVVRCPKKPNTAPPSTSPAAMKIMQMVARAFLFSPNVFVNPTQVGYTPDQMDSCRPVYKKVTLNINMSLVMNSFQELLKAAVGLSLLATMSLAHGVGLRSSMTKTPAPVIDKRTTPTVVLTLLEMNSSPVNMK